MDKGRVTLGREATAEGNWPQGAAMHKSALFKPLPIH